MTKYVAAYDTEMSAAGRPSPEVPTCLEACRRIVEVHHEHRMPATFFLVGRTLEESPREYRRLLDDPLFEIASHTWSHRMLLDHTICGPAASPAEVRVEIERGRKVVEDVFGRACAGLRPGCGYCEGLRGAREILDIVSGAGYRYVSSLLWGEDFTLPVPFRAPFLYTEEGHPHLWELPAQGWHENLLKGNNRVFGQASHRVLLFPPVLPEAIPPRAIRTPEEEIRYNNAFFLETAVAGAEPYVSLIWHPWSLGLFDPDMRMLDLTFRLVRERGLEPCTYAELPAVLEATRPSA